MKKFFISALMALFAITMHAQVTPTQVVSPNGKLTVNLFCQEDGTPSYSIQYNGKEAISESPLGLITNEANLAEGLTPNEIKTSKIDKTYTLERSKQSEVHYEANSLIWKLNNAQGVNVLNIEFRVSNNDVAMRYMMPKTGETGSVRVMSEKTGFSLPKGTTTFLTPQSDAMIGWKRTKPSYEELYTYDAPMSQRSQYGHGYTFPCLFNVKEQGLWVLISETGVDSRYCASHLSDAGFNPLRKNSSIFRTSQIDTYTIAYPMPEENNGIGSAEPAIALPGTTPWRTITIGETLKPIAETTAPWDNVEPLYQTKHQYKPGRGTWSWILWQDGSINFDDQCKYIDLANAMGYEYVLIDNWWDTNIGKAPGAKNIDALIKYGKSKNVDVILWYSSSGYWNDIVQGPINHMDNAIIRKREMKWLQEHGVKGIKVDFFGGDKQETMRLYEEILSDADDHGLFVIFHGCTIPRGWEIMYPNYVGSEAVLASENLVFDQRFCDLEAKHACLHPVIRNAIGCMEWGGSFQNKVMNQRNAQREGKGKSPERITTSTFSLATAVLFQNPAQNFALAPNNLEDAPKVSMDFMREVPTTWDETRFIDGYPGKYMCLARRHGDKWYIGAIAAEDATVSIDMSQFDGAATIISGGDNPTSKAVKADKKGIVKLTIKANDGVVIY